MFLIKRIIISVFSLAMALVMWNMFKNSNPPREQHQQAVEKVVHNVLARIFEEKIRFPEQSREIAEYLSTNVIPQAVERLTRDQIGVEDFLAFSVGSIQVDEDDSRIVSIGILGKVFTFGEEDAYDYVKDYIDEEGLDKILQQSKQQQNGNKKTK